MREGTSHLARCHSESASTRTISAEGSLSSRQIRTAPQRERFDTHDLRRRFAELKTNSHGATARALRHARSPQKVRRAQDKFARRHSQSASTRTISAEGSLSTKQIRTAPQPERFDTHDLRRGFAELKTNSHGATATISAEGSPSSRQIRTAPQPERFDTHDLCGRHAQSPQKVRRAQDTFARGHSESASTRTISAEQPERFDTHDLCKGFTFVLQRWQMSETLRLRRNSQTLFPKMLRLPRIICISAKHAHKSEDRRGATARAQF